MNGKSVLSKNLQYYMDINGISRNKLCADLKLKYTTVSEWLNANRYPRINKLEQLAAYFKIRVSDLVEEPFYIRKERDLLDITDLSDSQKKIINDMIKVFKNGK